MKLNKLSKSFENKQELLKQQNTVAISQGLTELVDFSSVSKISSGRTPNKPSLDVCIELLDKCIFYNKHFYLIYMSHPPFPSAKKKKKKQLP